MYSAHLSKTHGVSMEGKRLIKLKCREVNCHETIFTKSRWRFHNIYSHSNIQCSVCNFLLSGIRYVPKHFRDFHSELGSECVQFVPEPTNFSDNKPAYMAALRQVKRFNSSTFKESAQHCGICQKVYVNTLKLNAHIRFNHGGHDRAQICQFCGLNLRTRANLKVHLDSHSAVPYKCHICSKLIKTKMNLKNHMDLVHLKTRSYPCPDCDRVYQYWPSLNYHKRTQHNNTHINKRGIVKKKAEKLLTS